MNRDKQSKPARPALRFYLLTAFALLILCGLPDDVLSQTQWTTTANGTDIYNTAGGNVGIGTNAPNRRLTIFDTDTNVPTLTLKTGSSGMGLMDGFDLQFTNSNTYIWNRENGPMMFGTNNAERLRITNAGNVGIGTNNPVSQLEIAGAAPFITLTHGNGLQDNSEVMYRNNAGFYKWAIINYSDANISPELQNSLTFYQFTDKNNAASDQLRMVINNEGNVGIGKRTPAYKLDVAGTFNASAIYQNGLPFSSSQWATGTGNISYSSGNVGIGTQTPGYKLDVNGNVNFQGGTTYFRQSSGLAGGEGTLFNTGGTINNESYFDMAVYRGGSYTSRFGVDNYGRVYLQPGGGNVGIGTATPTKTLDVAGDINASGTITGGNIVAKYQDVAEWVPSTHAIAPATVVVLDPDKSNQVLPSTQAYDTRVAGVISAQPGITLGERGEGKVLVATTGRVKVKVDATRAPIHVGDLLVTSDEGGMAMKSEPIKVGGIGLHRPGTLIGKALEPLAQGKGEILVLLSLQ